MKKFKKFAQSASLSFQNRLILSYTFILVLILVVGSFLYQFSFQQVKNGINAQDATMLSSSVRRLDYTISTISTVAQQISANSTFATLAGYDSSNYEFQYQAYLTKQDLKPILPQAHVLSVTDAFIYMKNSGYIISSSEFLTFESYARYKLFCTPEMARNFEEALNIESYRNRFISLHEFDSRRNGYLYFYPIAIGNVFSEKYIQAYLCCMLDQDLLEDYFPGLLQADSTIIAHDSGGNEKFRLSKGDPEGNRSKLLATIWQSDYNNWQYTLLQPEEQTYYSINNYRNLFIAITVLALLLEGMMVYYFSIINSKPVIRLSNELVVTEKLASSLSDLIEKHQPLVTESYMRRIMEGNVTTDDEMNYIIEELHLNRVGIKYQVLYVEVYPSEDFNVQLDDMALCLQNFDVLVRDGLKRHFPDTGYIYKPSDRIFAVLLASPESMTYDQIMLGNREAFTALHTELLSQFGIWSRGGFGGLNTRPANTWKSYQQAKDAKSITNAEHYIQSYHDFISSNDVYYYPEIMSVQLTGAISAGNKDLVAELFRLIKKENTVVRILTPTQMQQLVFDVRSTLFKKRHSIPPAGSERNSADPDDRQKKHLDMIDRQFEGELNLVTLNNIAIELCNFFVQKSSSNELVVKIQNYITENYHDPSLCLTKISDEFNISENYFSFLFKKEVHENFSSYLEKLRMAKAKELVLHSDTGLSNLYQYLGYSNVSSFRRVFKKTFGVSPKEMREHKNA
ncbi:MAG: helix-turn-helix domain-containing protein [Lachnospiraceae bacterium]